MGVLSRDAPDLPDLGPAPSLSGLHPWHNTPDERPLATAGLRGRVVLVHFWTYVCANCVRTLPHVRALDCSYRAQGLTVVGVHTPEVQSDRNPRRVAEAVSRLRVQYAVGMDNDFIAWNAWSVAYWPSLFLVDATGRVRYSHVGEGSYRDHERAVEVLLAEADAAAGRSSSTAWAASRPGAPLTAPPGCAPEPAR